MKIISIVKKHMAVLTFCFATVAADPAAAQTPRSTVKLENLTQIRLKCNSAESPCTSYDKIAANRWVEVTGNIKDPFYYVEKSRTDSRIVIAKKSAAMALGSPATTTEKKITFDLDQMTFDSSTMLIDGSKGAGASSSGFISGIYEISSNNSPETCSRQAAAAGVKCTCELGALRPLQGAVGMEEVRSKQNDIEAGKKTRLDLAYDPIKIVRGPDRLFYVTDHHHGARAWLEAGAAMGTCVIQDDTISTDPLRFWSDIKAKNLVRLADRDGRVITEAQLPLKLKDLPDDAYRTLAWRVRKKDGFCRAYMNGKTDFAEFQWADWLRSQKSLPYPGENAAWSKGKVNDAVRLARSPEASHLPGYNASGSNCPPDPQ